MPLFTVALLQFQKHELFRQLELRFEKKQIVQLTLPVNQLTWAKKNKELIIDGQMFDVKHIVIDAGIATFTGFFDIEEDELNKHLSKSHSKQKQADQGKIAWHLIHLFTCGPVVLAAPFVFIPAIENDYHNKIYNLSSRPISVLIPPPLG